MQKRALRFRTSETVSIRDLEDGAEQWLLDGEARELSDQTLASRRILTTKLVWYLRQQEVADCGTSELRRFLAYLRNGHEDAGGRWGNARFTKRVKSATVYTYHGNLRTFFGFLVTEGVLDESPMDAVAAPVNRPDQIKPFTQDQVDAYLTQTKKTEHPKRNELIVLMLLDTGARASELCGLRVRDVNITQRRFTVLGKGNKQRVLPFGIGTTRAMWSYRREQERALDAPLFASDRGKTPGEGITRSGLLQLIRRMGTAAGIEDARCSPHTFRHTFAVSFLRNGGNVFTLKELLGHTSLAMVNRYVQLAEADIENQHRQYSPVDRMRKKKGEGP